MDRRLGLVLIPHLPNICSESTRLNPTSNTKKKRDCAIIILKIDNREYDVSVSFVIE